MAAGTCEPGRPGGRALVGAGDEEAHTVSTLTTKKIGATVGAEVLGLEPDRQLQDETLPAACMEALQENGVLVFRKLHIDDDTQVAFSKRLDYVGKAEPSAPPRIFNVTLDPTKSTTAAYLRE